MRKSLATVAGAVALAIANCQQAQAEIRPAEQSPPKVTPAPSYAGTIGIPVHATAPDGSTADVTLNGARVKDDHCLGALPCLVLELTIVGTSQKPFPYSASGVTWSYASTSDPWYGADKSIGWGPAAGDYRPFMPPGPLLSGQVGQGETKHGLVMSMIGSPHEPIMVFLSSYDPNTSGNGTPRTREAAWQVTVAR
ncbi:hypothetical protein [Nocardia tengchongensis]|uniref:hypothetical protein n=1 Tax=Nocardia tengchongensis TaxID=2055889 RepID=UPI003619F104